MRSGGTDEGRELDGATVTTAGVVDTAATDTATLCAATCLGEAGAAGSTGVATLAAGLSPNPVSVAE